MPSNYLTSCPEILFEPVATHTYCIFFTVYSIGGIKITKSVPAIYDSFFKWSRALSELHHVRGRWMGGGVRGRNNPRNRAEVIMLTIPCIILFRISCKFPALCSRFHALFSKLFPRSLSKQSRSSQNDTFLQRMTILLV